MKPQTYWFPSTVPNRLPSPFFTLITTPSHKNLRHIRETPPVDDGCKLGGSSYGWSFTTCGRGWVLYWAWLRHGCGLVLCDCEDHRMVVIAIFWLWQRFYSIVLVPTLKINKWTSWCVLRITSVQPSVQSDHSMRYIFHIRLSHLCPTLCPKSVFFVQSLVKDGEKIYVWRQKVKKTDVVWIE